MFIISLFSILQISKCNTHHSPMELRSCERHTLKQQASKNGLLDRPNISSLVVGFAHDNLSLQAHESILFIYFYFVFFCYFQNWFGCCIICLPCFPLPAFVSTSVLLVFIVSINLLFFLLPFCFQMRICFFKDLLFVSIEMP